MIFLRLSFRNDQLLRKELSTHSVLRMAIGTEDTNESKGTASVFEGLKLYLGVAMD